MAETEKDLPEADVGEEESFREALSQFRSSFIDSLRIFVRGGAGGHGLPKYGGVGGKGGDVYFEGTKFESLKIFLQNYPHRNVSAHSGENSKKGRIFGEPGKDKIVKVPVGVTVYDESNRKLGEINGIGEKLKVASGGAGGSPTSHPPFGGAKGEERMITLDLKLIADVGLVGFPNAGKSTLLKAISRASPKIASYAFTTLKPNLGTVRYEDLRQISVADLPGLVEGASHDVGMGHKFLKHVERTSLLLMIVDVDGFQLSPAVPYRSCLDTVILLNKELELYDESLLRKPIVLAINKMDLPDSSRKVREMMPHLENLKECVSKVPEDMRPSKVIQFREIVQMSARFDKKSVNELKLAIRRVMDASDIKSLSESVRRREERLLSEIRRACTELGTKTL